MIRLEHTEVVGWEAAIRGMRNPMNSWDRSDSKMVNTAFVEKEISPGVTRGYYEMCEPYISIGDNDHELMMKLIKGGAVHAKFRRMIVVYVDITAPLYFWKEFDTYKVGTACNSCSTMHKIHSKAFELDDFSHEHLYEDALHGEYWEDYLNDIIDGLNKARLLYLKDKDKKYWWQMIQLLPSSYNQKRTIMLNYEVLNNIYISRKEHKLDEWRELCEWIKTLPYSEIITGEDK